MNECSSALICSRTPHRTIITGTQQCECCSKSNVLFHLQASFKGFTEFKSRQLRSEHGCAFRIALLALNRTVLSSVSPYLPHNCTVPALYCGAKKNRILWPLEVICASVQCSIIPVTHSWSAFLEQQDAAETTLQGLVCCCRHAPPRHTWSREQGNI